VALIAVLLVGAAWGWSPALADQQRLSGQVVDFDRSAGTCELELQQGSGGGFTTVHLDHDAMWAMKKMEVGDFIEASVVKENDKLVAKEVALRMGPVPEIDSLQGTVTKLNRRDYSIEVKVSPGGKEELLYLDPSSQAAIGDLKAGDRIEARVETVLEKKGPKRVIRVLVVGMGP
jgi:hypothetical protein